MSASTRMAGHWLARGQTALQAGRRAEALAALRQAVASDPNCVDALLWLAGLCDNPSDSLRHLTRALTLDPQNQAAHDGLRWARKRLHEQSQTPAAAIPRFLGTPAPQTSRQIEFMPEVVPVESPAQDVTPAYRTPLTTRVAGPPAYAAQPARETAFGAPTHVAPLPIVAVPHESAPAPKQDSAAVRQSAPRAARKLSGRAVRLCAALVVIVGVSIGLVMSQLLKPSVPVSMAMAAPTVVPAPAAASAAAPSATPAASAPVAEAPVDTAQLYAQRANEALAQLDDAWAKEDWDRAIPLVAQALTFRPGDADLKQKLMAAYFNRAVAQMDNGDLDDALKSYDQALTVVADPAVKAERDALVNYQAGVAQYNRQNWTGTVQYLTRVYAQDAGYLDTRELLYRAYYNQGVALRAAKDLNGAAKAYQSAVDLDNTAIEARGELAQVKALLAPPPA
jgi:tetratricopeptide (TPR) repeat protein